MRIGIDLGGTKIEGIVMDKDGKVQAQKRIDTPAAEGYKAIVEAIGGLVEHLESEAKERCTVGICTPGAVSGRTGRMKNCNSTSLNGEPLPKDLETRLDREVRIANDANAFALSEASDGAAAGHNVVFGVIMGTGVGGGIVFKNTVHAGPNVIAGEWGHTPLKHDGPDCYCGRQGCVETLLSGPGLLRDYKNGGGTACADTAAIVKAAAEKSDPKAVAAMERYIWAFGRSIANVIDILDPDAIVLGGGMSNLDVLYTAGVDAVRSFVFSDELRTPILRNKFGDSSGVRGAAWLWG